MSTALLTILISQLPAILADGAAIVQFIAKLRSSAQQSSAWDDAHEAVFVKLVADTFNLPQWQSDSERAAGIAKPIVPPPALAATAPGA